LPTQQELSWSKLRVGITILVAAVTLALLVILMGSSTGILTKKIKLTTYFDNAEGLRSGAAVRVEGVDVGNVTSVSVVPGAPLPVKVEMKVTTKYSGALRKDSMAALSTAGVLGETFVDISSIGKHQAPAQDGDTLPSVDRPGIQDVVKSSQTTLDNANILLGRLDKIIGTIENGQGSIGKLINDPALYNNANLTLKNLQSIADQIQNGNGSIGKLLNSDELYVKLNGSVDRLNHVLDGIERGEGTAGRLVKDPSLYNNANATIAKANALIEDINAGRGTLGLIAKDKAFADKVNNTMSRIDNISRRLDAGEGSAGKILKDPALYNDADQMLIETRGLIQAVRQNPKKYLTIRLRIF
jgi:phospholipid/cholesterol/gamma-HCH transport system substrate-binding protein